MRSSRSTPDALVCQAAHACIGVLGSTRMRC
jgi:hypothetical protein